MHSCPFSRNQWSSSHPCASKEVTFMHTGLYYTPKKKVMSCFSGEKNHTIFLTLYTGVRMNKLPWRISHFSRISQLFHTAWRCNANSGGQKKNNFVLYERFGPKLMSKIFKMILRIMPLNTNLFFCYSVIGHSQGKGLWSRLEISLVLGQTKHQELQPRIISWPSCSGNEGS